MGEPDVREPIFIVGSGRSGTTLLRSLISDHPQVALLPRESHFLNAFAPRYRNADLDDPAMFERCWTDLIGNERFQRLGIDPHALRNELDSLATIDLRAIFTSILRLHAEGAGKPRSGDKTPSHFKHIHTILDWYPDARVLFMVRDPRAVWASYLKVGEAWSDLPPETIILGWRESVYELRRWSDSPRVAEVRYETLVAEPERELHRIFDWLGLDYPEGLLDREAGSRRKTGAFHQDGPVRTGSVDRWRGVLRNEQVDRLERMVGPEMEEHGYEPTIEVTGSARMRSRRDYTWYRARRVLGVARANLRRVAPSRSRPLSRRS